MELTLLIIIAIIQCFSSLYEIVIKDGKLNWKDNIKAIILFVGFVFAIVLIVVSESVKTKTEQATRDTLRNYQISIRDSINNLIAKNDSIHNEQDSMLSLHYEAKVDSSYQKSITASNEALAKYNLVLVDSLNRVTEKVNLKGMPTATYGIDAVRGGLPSIYIDENSSMKEVKFRFAAFGNTVFNIRVDILALAGDPFVPSTLRFLAGANLILESSSVEKQSTVAIVPVDPTYRPDVNQFFFINAAYSLDRANQEKRQYLMGFNVNQKTGLVAKMNYPKQINAVYDRAAKTILDSIYKSLPY